MQLPSPRSETDPDPDPPSAPPLADRIDPAPVAAQLAAQLDLARAGVDPEGVHQLRVACRRLVVWLQIARRHGLRSDLRWLRGAAAGVRDLDVLIARSLPEPVRDWLRDERRRAHARLTRAIDTTRTAGLLEALGHLRPIPAGAAERELGRLRRLAVERGEALAAPARDAHAERARLHDLRRALRRLRYTLGWVGQDRRSLRRLQAALGGLNDLELLHVQLQRYPAPGRIAELVADVEARAAALHGACVEAWEQSREEIRALAIDG